MIYFKGEEWGLLCEDVVYTPPEITAWVINGAWQVHYSYTTRGLRCLDSEGNLRNSATVGLPALVVIPRTFKRENYNEAICWALNEGTPLAVEDAVLQDNINKELQLKEFQSKHKDWDDDIAF